MFTRYELTLDNYVRLGFPAPLYSSKLIKNIYVYIFNFCIEPVGAKGPTFSADSKSYTFVRAIGQSFALLCQAQSFPVPLFRQVLVWLHICFKSELMHWKISFFYTIFIYYILFANNGFSCFSGYLFNCQVLDLSLRSDFSIMFFRTYKQYCS